MNNDDQSKCHPFSIPGQLQIEQWHNLAQAHYPEFDCRLEFRDDAAGVRFRLCFRAKTLAQLRRASPPLFPEYAAWEPMEMWYREDGKTYLEWLISLYPDQSSVTASSGRLIRPSTIALTLVAGASSAYSYVVPGLINLSLPVWERLTLNGVWMGCFSLGMFALCAAFTDLVKGTIFGKGIKLVVQQLFKQLIVTGLIFQLIAFLGNFDVVDIPCRNFY